MRGAASKRASSNISLKAPSTGSWCTTRLPGTCAAQHQKSLAGVLPGAAPSLLVNTQQFPHAQLLSWPCAAAWQARGGNPGRGEGPWQRNTMTSRSPQRGRQQQHPSTAAATPAAPAHLAQRLGHLTCIASSMAVSRALGVSPTSASRGCHAALMSSAPPPTDLSLPFSAPTFFWALPPGAPLAAGAGLSALAGSPGSGSSSGIGSRLRARGKPHSNCPAASQGGSLTR